MDPAKIDFLGATNVHPMDILEPEPEDSREQDRLRSAHVPFLLLDAIKSALRWDVGFHQVSYAIGHATEPMSEVAERLGVDESTISAGEASRQKALEIPPSVCEQDRLRLVQVLFIALDAMKSARRWDVGFHQVSYALGHATEPMAEVAARLGVERATLSAGAVSLCKALDIPPSASMRSEDARQAYHDSRTSKLDQ